MGTNPFVDAKLQGGKNAKLPKQRLSAAERLRRPEDAITFLQEQLAAGPQPAKTLLQAAKLAVLPIVHNCSIASFVRTPHHYLLLDRRFMMALQLCSRHRSLTDLCREHTFPLFLPKYTRYAFH